jgi:hypothetical protein
MVHNTRTIDWFEVYLQCLIACDLGILHCAKDNKRQPPTCETECELSSNWKLSSYLGASVSCDGVTTPKVQRWSSHAAMMPRLLHRHVSDNEFL